MNAIITDPLRIQGVLVLAVCVQNLGAPTPVRFSKQTLNTHYRKGQVSCFRVGEGEVGEIQRGTSLGSFSPEAPCRAR